MLSPRTATLVLAGLVLVGGPACRQDVWAAERMAPPFPSTDPEAWLGAPQSIGALHGKVVLLDVWTFG